MSNKIPITVVTGFLGSGKTTLLNRLLHSPDMTREANQIAIVINEIGDIGLDHQLVKHISNSVVLLESGCVCCSVRGELVDALRELFMAALQKRIPPFSRVLIETTGLADPAPIMYTLQYERFLSERYIYDGCISVVDSTFGRRQLREHNEAMQQAVLADAIVLSKTDLADAGEVAVLKQALSEINLTAPLYDMQSLPPFSALLEAGSLHTTLARDAARMAGRPTKRFGEDLNRLSGSGHAATGVITIAWSIPIARSVFIRAMSALQTLDNIELLRIKGIVQFQGETRLSVVHGVHQQLYPIEFADNGELNTDGGTPGSFLVFILRGASQVMFEEQARSLLFGAAAH